MRPFSLTFALLCLARSPFPQPTFEVASIKLVDTTKGISNVGVSIYPGGRIVLHALSLKALIAAAWDVGYWQLSRGEAWSSQDVYDIEAKPAPQSGSYSLRHTRFGIGDERLRQMLRALLTDRFQLKVRTEATPGTVYLLQRSDRTFGPSPSKYTEDRPALGAPGFSGEVAHTGGHWFLFNVSMAQLARFASDYVLHKPVIDKTGLEGSFDYRDPDAAIPQEQDFEGTFGIFVRHIGLKLTPSKGPVTTLMIEHAEKPDAN